MNKEHLNKLLTLYKEDKLGIDDLMEQFSVWPFEDIKHTKLDFHRTLRNGHPEVIFGEGKSLQQLKDIIDKMLEHKLDVLATRIDETMGTQLLTCFPQADYHPLASCFCIQHQRIPPVEEAPLLIITAGTSDLPVAEEALISAQMLGHQAEILSDVGVAGIHRLFAHLDKIRKAKVIIVVAGMEGALGSVVGGLVDAPLIAVPTSIGYGANFSGLSALLGMLTSCANGITVVNINNGYGAAYAASKILNGK